MFVPAMHPRHEIEEVKRLLDEFLTHREISERTGVPRNTIRNWLYKGFPPRGTNVFPQAESTAAQSSSPSGSGR
jgi:hypothetical protein